MEKEQFTSVAWSLEQPNIVFLSGESGTLEVWDLNKRRSEPIQTQNISGRAINGKYNSHTCFQPVLCCTPAPSLSEKLGLDSVAGIVFIYHKSIANGQASI